MLSTAIRMAYRVSLPRWWRQVGRHLRLPPRMAESAAGITERRLSACVPFSVARLEVYHDLTVAVNPNTGRFTRAVGKATATVIVNCPHAHLDSLAIVAVVSHNRTLITSHIGHVNDAVRVVDHTLDLGLVS